MRSSAVLILAAFVAEATAYYNYTFPTGFNLGQVPSNLLSTLAIVIGNDNYR